MSSIPLNHLLKIGADALQTTAQTLSGAINELKTTIGNVASSIPSVSVWRSGTASGTTVRKQGITVNSTTTDIDGTTYMQLTQDIHTTNGNTFVFSNPVITSNSVIDCYTSDFKIQPDNITVVNGMCVVVVPAADTATNLTVRIYIK